MMHFNKKTRREKSKKSQKNRQCWYGHEGVYTIN